MHIPCGHRFFQLLRKSAFEAVLLGGLAAQAPSACARVTDPANGSETHFLAACNVSCGSNLECVDGQCSASCNNDSTCETLDRNSTCGQQPSGKKACEVTCVDDDDCADIRRELSCNAGVCRGPLWRYEVEPSADASDGSEPPMDATDESSEDTSDAACGAHPGCPPSESMSFRLPKEGIGTVRLEFMLNLSEAELVRCTTEFIDDALVDSSCESNAVAPAILDEACDGSTACAGSLRFDVRADVFQVNYWRANDYQTLPLDGATWLQNTFDVGPDGCNFSCTTTELEQPLPSLKNNACLNPESECGFRLGCGDRQSALAKSPACDDSNRTLSASEGCDYDILVYQEYIEGSRAFYDKDTGEFVGFWHRSDTFFVECSGQVPVGCTDSSGARDVCETSDAGTNEGGPSD